MGKYNSYDFNINHYYTTLKENHSLGISSLWKTEYRSLQVCIWSMSCSFEKKNCELLSPLIKKELENIMITTSSITILVNYSNLIILWV